MEEKIVLIIEDEATQRGALEIDLKVRGFQTYSAGTIEESRALLNKMGDQADVVVLDMRLEDPKEPQTTGADLGIEFLNERRQRERWEDVRASSLPEFLILSAYAEADYYRKAMDLDVAAYLQKQQKNQEEVIRHVRALSLRRALNIGQPQIIEKVSRIAERSRTPFEAVIKLCRKILAPEFKATLGAPFVIFLGNRGRAEKCGGDPDLPEVDSPIYGQIQALVHGQSNRSEPFVLNKQLLQEPHDKETYWMYERMDGGAFLPFWLKRDLRLTVGILRDTGGNKLAEDPKSLCEILDQYLRPSILEHTVDILTRLTRLKVQRETVLTMTSKSCISTGQEQLALLEDGRVNHEVNPDSGFFKKMKGLAEDLRATGETLLPLGNGDGETGYGTESRVSGIPLLKIVEIVSDAWSTVQDQIETEGIESPSIFTRSEFKELEVQATRVELLLAMVRILQWMVQRKQRVPKGGRQQILIEWLEQDESMLVAFEDRSARLSQRWRQFLFDPFTQAASQGDWKYESYELMDENENEEPSEHRRLRAGRYLPLYLAKMLVELKNGGELKDDTENMEGHDGHRFVMSFPKHAELTAVTHQVGVRALS
jgi:CheY-like chemotaxis protein